MDLSTIINDKTKAIQFINQNFTSNEDQSPLSPFAPLFMYRINRIIKDKSISFNFYGIPSLTIDAYIKSKTEFTIYFSAKIKDMLGFNKITNQLGYPVNITVEDYDAGDFDFLNWRQDGFEIFASHLHREEANILFTIGNISFKELLKIDNIERSNGN
ncbi:MAG: hypothetical protein P0Y49_18665 [Candidatus Pedobacter colombiensis]|uniref:Uncharacterized protein n=1 Tax=Candidatus Pedobacter colombiensis TaxID=3121371 RepID=A0AAJ5W6B4_9SPHI|nr:hypothetical protein [Pedobacter sp.]WEK18802.1 MAG: hypothetical protein P0Y49_18665 [Pedobacter sp.]